MPRFRLIPLTIMVAALFIAVKVVDIIRGSEDVSQVFIAGVQAESAPEEPKEIPDMKEDEGEEGNTDEKETSKDCECEEEAVATEGNPRVSNTPGITIDNHLSEVQIQLLQRLAQRRQELQRWADDILLKENLLDATQKRIDSKIEQIETMKEEVSKMLSLYNEKEDAKIRSLVKIYESMKPKDAARIFDEVEMPILLLVIDKMSERKVAPILADMDSKKVRELTVQLAEQRKVDAARLNRLNPNFGKTKK